MNDGLFALVLVAIWVLFFEMDLIPGLILLVVFNAFSGDDEDEVVEPLPQVVAVEAPITHFQSEEGADVARRVEEYLADSDKKEDGKIWYGKRYNPDVKTDSKGNPITLEEYLANEKAEKKAEAEAKKKAEEDNWLYGESN